MEEVPDFRKLEYDTDPQIRKLIHYAKVLEGSARHTGVHAAGVIIAPGNVSEYVPISVAKSKNDDVVTTQYDGNWVESFGLLKMDFLGLKTLTVLNDTLELIEKNRGITIDIDAIPLDDERTYELFQRGETIAIFQFESSGMREWMLKLKPTCIDDLIAMNALYRPGPMDLIPNYIARKHGNEKVDYPHPMLEPVLKPTYGIPVYQEQVMQMAQVMGGYTLGGADLLRRAMSKKKKKVMKKHRLIFVEGAKQRDVPEKIAHDVYDMMDKFSGYGFNKSHSAAYSIVAYQTAYLKAHYTPEFMAAAMTNEMGDTKKLAVILEEARHLGLEILPPSVNKSQAFFSVEKEKIRFGLGAIKGVGLGAIEAIVETREKNGPFETIYGLTRELDLKAVNKKALDSLTRSGAMDDVDGHRAQLVEAVDMAVQYAQRVQAERASGQNSLFGGQPGMTTMEPNLPVVEPWPRSILLKAERELLGFYVSGHPLEAYLAETRAFSTVQLGDTAGIEAEVSAHQKQKSSGDGYMRERGPVHSICGIITSVQRRTTKKGKPIAFFSLEDFSGQAEVICFSSLFDRVQNYLVVDEIVLVQGEVELRGGDIKIIAQDVFPMWKVREQLVKSIILRLDADQVQMEQIEKLGALCDANRGTKKLYFDLIASDLPGGPQRIHSRKFVVDPTPELIQGITRLFGRDNMIFEGEL